MLKNDEGWVGGKTSIAKSFFMLSFKYFVINLKYFAYVRPGEKYFDMVLFWI